MRIASYNINNVVSRLQPLCAWLDVTRPDVVCLQELKATTDSFPTEALRELGYASLVHGQKTWNGVAILARDAEPIEIRRALPGDPEDRQSRYLEAAINGVIVGCLYAPNGNPQPGPKFDYKLAWLERLNAHAASLIETGLPVLLIGDFNIVPTDAPADVYSTGSWHDDALLHPAARDAWQRLLAQGWSDLLRETHPDAALYTYWSYLRNRWPRDAGLRIDHILTSPSLRPRCTDAGVDKAVRGLEGASDHAPVWVDVEPSTD